MEKVRKMRTGLDTRNDMNISAVNKFDFEQDIEVMIETSFCALRRTGAQSVTQTDIQSVNKPARYTDSQSASQFVN